MFREQMLSLLVLCNFNCRLSGSDISAPLALALEMILCSYRLPDVSLPQSGPRSRLMWDLAEMEILGIGNYFPLG